MPTLVWFRRDLRLHDQTALFEATKQDTIIPLFIFDPAILKHDDCGANIVEFMLGCISELSENLKKLGGKLILRYGKPIIELRKLIKETGATRLYFNRDYAPGAIERDEEIIHTLSSQNFEVKSFKDQVIFEEDEILAKSSGGPYTVYSPYRKAWEKKIESVGWDSIAPLPLPKIEFAPSIKMAKSIDFPTTQSLSFKSTATIKTPAGESAGRSILQSFCKSSLKNYKTSRNLPADDRGTSHLSAHLRHGTISPRTCIYEARKASPRYCSVWIGELIWRDFFQQVLFHYPEVEAQSFKALYRDFPWKYDKKQFKAWCDGQTGYPLVDAAMRQLNQTGWMHNRLRMVVAMFLTKDLLIDYKWGERYFINHLIDGEAAQNNGNWQWCASTGVDAQPWFRIFNPTNQSEKFDPRGDFIRKFCPELRRVPVEFIHAPFLMSEAEQKKCNCIIGRDYPAPMVDHAKARQETLQHFKSHRRK